MSALVCNQMTSCAANTQKKQTSAVLRPEFIDAQQLRPCYIDWIKIKRCDPWIPAFSLRMTIYQDWGLETIRDQPLVSEGCRPMNGNSNVWLLIGTNTSEKQNALDNWINTHRVETLHLEKWGSGQTSAVRSELWMGDNVREEWYWDLEPIVLWSALLLKAWHSM